MPSHTYSRTYTHIQVHQLSRMLSACQIGESRTPILSAAGDLETDSDADVPEISDAEVAEIHATSLVFRCEHHVLAMFLATREVALEEARASVENPGASCD